MSLNSIMNIATSGMKTAQSQLRVTADNIANVDTPGYVRKVADQSAAVTNGYGSGVDITRVRLATDRFLQAAGLSAGADAARQGVRAQLYGQVQSQFGDPSSDTNFFAQVDKLFANYAALAESPTSSARARKRSTRPNRCSTRRPASPPRSSPPVRRRTVGCKARFETINPLLEQIDKLNKTIAGGSVTNQDVTGAQNAQLGLINELSKYLDVKVEARSNGGVTLRTNAGTTLVGEGHATVSYQAAGTVDATTAFSDIMITEPSGTRWPLLDGVSSGQIRGLIEMRDVDAPAAAARLGELTAKLADELNRRPTTPSSSLPAPTTLTGRNTGAVAAERPDRLCGYDHHHGRQRRRRGPGLGADRLLRRDDDDQRRSRRSFHLPERVERQMGGAVTASFADGRLQLDGAGGNGVAIADDATSPSNKGRARLLPLVRPERPGVDHHPDLLRDGPDPVFPARFRCGREPDLPLRRRIRPRQRDVTVSSRPGPARWANCWAR
ncbi:FlgK family flagellar hook-associated protein [Brevundimonas sp.]|uniref:FlgK family flagellar hook-associated protein n=1 Tax=Brevundimonas sp. TaxID=1871086 RepID=UPI003AFF6F31